MTLRLMKALAPRRALLALAITLAAFGSAEPATADGPFAGMSGAWSGGGQVVLDNGTAERIRCRATYMVEPGGNSMRQELRCASDSYKFELSSNVTHQGGYISGQWAERTRGAGGTVSGSVSGNQIRVLVEGGNFSASLTLTTRGNSQSVVILPRGFDVKQVSMSLRKG